MIDRVNHSSSEPSLLGLIDECLEAETLSARLFVDDFVQKDEYKSKMVDPWGNSPLREEVCPGLFRLQWAGKDKVLDTCDDIFASVELRDSLMDSQWSCIEDSIGEVGGLLRIPPEGEVVMDNRTGGTISIHSSGCFTSLFMDTGKFGSPLWGGEISIDRCTPLDVRKVARESLEVDSRSTSSESVSGEVRRDRRSGLVHAQPESERTVDSMLQCAGRLKMLFRKHNSDIHNEYQQKCVKQEVQDAANATVARLVYLAKVGCGLDDWDQQLVFQAVRDPDGVFGLLLISRGQDGVVDTTDDISYYVGFADIMSELLVNHLCNRQKSACENLRSCRRKSRHGGKSCPDDCTDFYGRKLHCGRRAGGGWRYTSVGADGQMGTSDDIDDVR